MSRAFRWLFEDRSSGRIVIGQMPNATLWIVLAALAASFVVPKGRAATAADVVLFVALAVWALDETTRGVNPWRRILGVGTLVGMIAWLLLRR